jgi:hypothetical protein
MSRRRLRTTCRLCGARLKTYERPEGECDNCLRAWSLLWVTTR